MKRTISTFLSLVMALSLCACGGKSNETELTLDNYSTYLTVSASVSDPGLEDAVGVHSYNNGYGIPYDGGSTLYLYNHLNTAVTVVGSSISTMSLLLLDLRGHIKPSIFIPVNGAMRFLSIWKSLLNVIFLGMGKPVIVSRIMTNVIWMTPWQMSNGKLLPSAELFPQRNY